MEVNIILETQYLTHSIIVKYSINKKTSCVTIIISKKKL